MGTYFNYDDTSHQVIFDHINGGSGSNSLQEACREWQRLGEDVGVTGKSFVQSALRGVLASREGAAAEAAAAATAAMLPWMDDVALIASSAAQRAQGQANYWVTAKNSVPPVPPAPNSAGFFGDPGEWFVEKMDWFPGVTSEEERAQQRLQDAAEQARQAMRVYQSSSNGNIDPAPAFTAPQAWDGSMGALPLIGTHVSGAGAAPVAAAGGGTGAHQAHLLAAHQPAGGQPVATASQLAQGGHAAPGVGTAPWAGNPTPVQGVTPGPLPVGTGFGNGSGGRGSARSTPVRGAAGARFAGAGTGRGGGPRRAGYGPQPSTGFGPRPAVRAPYSSVDETGGARGGVNSGGAASTGAGRGAGGAQYGAPFAAGAEQRGEQDREHRSKYLIHDDSHAIVGDLPPTAPPVIGEDPAY
ncbi:MAG TPA: PPE domain-containing protein [Pseudonocardiaceae bacterium]|nr:PPE domain-containing protein [Pseudonocardiaceae bacterium]